MSPWKRKFPRHPPSVRSNDFGIEVLWCNAGGCPVGHTTKSTIQGHLDSKKHPAAIETMKVMGLGTLWPLEGVWGGGNVGALLLLAEGVTPLLLNHRRRV